MTLPDANREIGLAAAAGRAAEVDWEAIKAMTGYTDEQIAKLQATWNRGPQTMDEVRAGVLWERKNRSATSE